MGVVWRPVAFVRTDIPKVPTYNALPACESTKLEILAHTIEDDEEEITHVYRLTGPTEIPHSTDRVTRIPLRNKNERTRKTRHYRSNKSR